MLPKRISRERTNEKKLWQYNQIPHCYEFRNEQILFHSISTKSAREKKNNNNIFHSVRLTIRIMSIKCCKNFEIVKFICAVFGILMKNDKVTKVVAHSLSPRLPKTTEKFIFWNICNTLQRSIRCTPAWCMCCYFICAGRTWLLQSWWKFLSFPFIHSPKFELNSISIWMRKLCKLQSFCILI